VETNMITVTRRTNTARLTRLTLLAVSLGIGAALSGFAQAGTPGTDAASVKVAYGDLDLATTEGTSTLYGRLVAAARTVCDASGVDNRDLHAVALERSCERRAISHAVADVHSPQLAALVSARVRHG
jgi:UrcA family protein